MQRRPGDLLAARLGVDARHVLLEAGGVEPASRRGDLERVPRRLVDDARRRRTHHLDLEAHHRHQHGDVVRGVDRQRRLCHVGGVEPLLEQPDVGSLVAEREQLRPGDRRQQRTPRQRPDDAVGIEPVGLLEGDRRGAGQRPEDAVGVERRGRAVPVEQQLGLGDRFTRRAVADRGLARRVGRRRRPSPSASVGAGSASKPGS